MSVHVISVLGTSLYEPVIYQGNKKDGIETEYVQISIINEFREKLEHGGKVTIFLTNRAENENWKDREYRQKEVEFASKWTSNKKKDVVEGNRKKGLQSLLREIFPELEKNIEFIKIPDMTNEDEIWEVFDKIYDCIDEDDELVFDITHSFRSIPMLAVTVINYAKVLKRCQLYGVYYGAFEAAKEGENCKIAPIINLTVFNEILEWTYAAESFVNYGNVDKMKEVYDKRDKLIPTDQKRVWKPIKQLISNMEDLSMGISTCRGADSQKLNKKEAACSVKQSCIKLKKGLENVDYELGKEIVPMMKLIEHASKQFETFDCEFDYQVGMEIVRWSIRFRMVQQGYTALEETIKTYICEKNGLDDISREMRESIVSSVLTAYAKYNQQPFDSEKFFIWCTQEDVYFKPTFNKLDEKMKNVVHNMVCNIPISLLILDQKVKMFRNDINHMGFNEDARSSSKLEKTLITFFEEFERIVQEKDDAI